MTCDDDRVFGQREDLLLQRLHDRVGVSAPEIGATDAAAEERVAREHVRARPRLNEERHAAWRVTRRV